MDGKSNEITAVPIISRQTDVKESTVSLDALRIGQKKGAIYDEYKVEAEKGPGRIEQRSIKVTDDLDWFVPTERKHWVGLRTSWR